ncbi:MAG: hypothetical protein KF774_21850 [Planctomyces sp.]|nr:hypothetical protein [Planctomyces sp.]
MANYDPEGEVELEPWTPPPDVTRHNGQPLPPEWTFFVAPPDGLGRILTAETTLRDNREEMPYLARWLVRLGLTGLGIVGGHALGRAAEGQLVGTPLPLTLALLMGVLGLLLGWLATRFRHVCTFVGEHGAAECSISGSRRAVPTDKVLLFEDVTELRAGRTMQYYNGLYTATTFDMTWTDGGGVKRFRRKGSYYSKKDMPRARNSYWFANSAETAWTAWLLERTPQLLDEQGWLEFRVHKKDAVRVAPGYLEFRLAGRVDRVPAEQIRDLGVQDGRFSIKTHEARWFSSAGKFTFDANAVSNLRVFEFALIHLLPGLHGEQAADEPTARSPLES